MKSSILTTAILFACAAGSAMADCTTSALVADVPTLLNNTLVCGRPGANYPTTPGFSATDRWQEEHISSGELWDYKLGTGPSVDPRKQVGRWSARGNQVQYNYFGGGTFTWEVRQISGSTYSFCLGSAEHARASVTPVASFPSAGCGGTFPP